VQFSYNFFISLKADAKMTEIGDENVTQHSKKKSSSMGYEELDEAQPPISYTEALANLFKGNVGTGK